MKIYGAVLAFALFMQTAVAGLPPTSTQGSAGGGYKTTFKFNFPGFPLSYSGTTATIGTLSVLGGGTGQTSYTDGQLLIGNSSGNTLTKATLTQGTGITITNGNGSITISASGGGAGNVYAARIASNAGSPTVTSQNGSWITSVSSGGTGTVNFVIAGGIFSNPPSCGCTYESTSFGFICNITTVPTSTSLQITTMSFSAVPSNQNFAVQCVGQ